jgi:hypothetical protein
VVGYPGRPHGQNRMGQLILHLGGDKRPSSHRTTWRTTPAGMAYINGTATAFSGMMCDRSEGLLIFHWFPRGGCPRSEPNFHCKSTARSWRCQTVGLLGRAVALGLVQRGGDEWLVVGRFALDSGAGVTVGILIGITSATTSRLPTGDV